jgi:hypothetical protein
MKDEGGRRSRDYLSPDLHACLKGDHREEKGVTSMHYYCEKGNTY